MKLQFDEMNKSRTYSTQVILELCGINYNAVQHIALSVDDFCILLNGIYCIIYCCIQFVCNNLVADQYVRIGKCIILFLL